MRVVPDGTAPFQPGGVMRKLPASVPVVRQPGEANTSVHMSSIGRRHVTYESGHIQDLVGKIYQETDGRPLQEFRIVQFHGQVFKWLAAGRRMRCIQCLKLLGRERQ